MRQRHTSDYFSRNTDDVDGVRVKRTTFQIYRRHCPDINIFHIKGI
jgi:hypothetical protein